MVLTLTLAYGLIALFGYVISWNYLKGKATKQKLTKQIPLFMGSMLVILIAFMVIAPKDTQLTPLALFAVIIGLIASIATVYNFVRIMMLPKPRR